MSPELMDLLQTGLRIVAAIIVFFIGRWLAGRVRAALSITLNKTPLAPPMTRLLLTAAYYGLLLAALGIALTVAGFSVDNVLTVAIVVVLVLGLLLRQSLSDLAAAITFMLFQPFRLGEVIKSNEVQGTVKEIQLFNTVLVTNDDVTVIIPNAKIQNDKLLNYTRQGQLRVEFVFTVGYECDLKHVKQVLSELISADPRVLTDPAPLIFVQELVDNGVALAVQPWVKPADYWPLRRDFVECVKVRFDAEGISLPGPQRDVRLYPMGSAAPVAVGAPEPIGA